MWKWAKRAKDIYSWFSFVSSILGALGLTAVISGIVVTVAGVVGSVMKGLPWPFVLMAAYCTLVGMAYLAALPFFIKAIVGLAPIPEGALSVKKREIVRPHYEAWKHLEKFTLREAAYLWIDLEPLAEKNNTEAAAWVEAFCGLIRSDKLAFIPQTRGSSMGRIDSGALRYQRDNPDSNTEVRREALIEFARTNDYKPKFLD
jgi:hypothetical protein